MDSCVRRIACTWLGNTTGLPGLGLGCFGLHLASLDVLDMVFFFF